MSDCLKGLPIEGRVQLAHTMNLRKGPPAHSGHLLFEQQLRVPKDPQVMHKS